MRPTHLHLLLAGLLILAASACSIAPEALWGRRGMLELEVEWVGGEPQDPYPLVFVDGKSMGHLSESWPILNLPRGEHQIQVHSRGFYPWSGMVYVAGEPSRQFLHVTLRKAPEAARPKSQPGG
jgi:hypothetical protein